MKKQKVKSKKHKLKLKTGDTVRVLRGRDRGKKGKILAVLPSEGRVLVEGISLVYRHVRPRRTGEKGQRVQVASPTRVSNVQLVCPQCKKGTRVAMRLEGDKRVRACKQCEAVIS